jgi:hypothetical protein
VGFLDFLGSLLSGGGAASAEVASLFAWLVNAMAALFSFLWGVLVAVANFLYGLIRALGKFLSHIWSEFFKKIWQRTLGGLIHDRVWQELRWGSLLDILRSLQRIFDAIFRRLIVPLLNLIQHIRRVLLILRLLHVRFAQRLDRQLARIQSGVARVFIEARSILNGIIDVVNGVSNPTSLVRIIVAVMRGRRIAGALTRGFTGLQIGFFLPSTQPGAMPWERPVLSCDDIADPERNPPPSVLIAGIFDQAPPVFSFTEGDTVVEDVELDLGEPLSFYDEVLAACEFAEAPIAACDYDIRLAIAKRLTCATGPGDVGIATVTAALSGIT